MTRLHLIYFPSSCSFFPPAMEGWAGNALRGLPVHFAGRSCGWVGGRYCPPLPRWVVPCVGGFSGGGWVWVWEKCLGSIRETWLLTPPLRCICGTPIRHLGEGIACLAGLTHSASPGGDPAAATHAPTLGTLGGKGHIGVKLIYGGRHKRRGTKCHWRGVGPPQTRGEGGGTFFSGPKLTHPLF